MEVLTVQLGHFANYVGAHFWNLQDEAAGQAGNDKEDECEFDFARIYAELPGRAGGTRWYPRVVAVDRRGALGAWDGGAGVNSGTEVTVAFGEQPRVEGFQLESYAGEAWDAHPFQRDLEAEEWAQWQEDDEAWEAEDRAWVVEDVDESADVAAASRSAFSAPARPSAMKPAAEYDFCHTVRTWTDFLKVRLREANVHELRSCTHDASSFSTFFDGLALRGRDDAEELFELLRRQAENCDRLDSVHVIYDMHDGFGGLATLVQEWAYEEAPKCGKLAGAFMPPRTVEASEHRPVSAASPSGAGETEDETAAWISGAFSFVRGVDTGLHAWIPAPVPLWSLHAHPTLAAIDASSFYDGSAAIAAALDVALLPGRFRGGMAPSQFLSACAPNGRPVCGLRIALPLPPAELMSGLDSPYFFDLSGMQPKPGNPFTSLVLRGDRPARLLALSEALHPRARRTSFLSTAPVALPLPFPQFFASQVSRRGVVGESRCAGEDVEECPVATHLHASAEGGRSAVLGDMGSALRGKRQFALAAKLRATYGVEFDELTEVSEAVMDHLECGAASDTGSDSGSGC